MGASPEYLQGVTGAPPSGHGAREPATTGEGSQVELPSFTRRTTGSAASRERARSSSNSATQSLCSSGSPSICWTRQRRLSSAGIRQEISYVEACAVSAISFAPCSPRAGPLESLSFKSCCNQVKFCRANDSPGICHLPPAIGDWRLAIGYSV